MKRTKRKFSAVFEAKVFIEALKESDAGKIGRKFELHPNQISQWKQKFLASADTVFDQPILEEEVRNLPKCMAGIAGRPFL